MRTDGALSPRSPDPVPAALLRLVSDERLVGQVEAGSEQAFAVLFQRHGPSVLAFCRRMLASPEEAEDAMQQTFLAAYCDLVGRETPRALRPWLYAIARNRCLAMLRARRDPYGGEPAEQTDYDLFTEVTTQEELRATLNDVARLPGAQRAALAMAELDGFSYEEIARLLACPRGKVKALVFQARSSLALSRAARDTPCAEIREQLSTLRGGALRRALLRRHIRDCPGCMAYREEIRSQRRRLRLLHPMFAVAGLKRSVLAAMPGSGMPGAGVAMGVGAVSVTGQAAVVLATAAISVGTVAVAMTSSDDGQAASAAWAPASGAAATARAAPPVDASPEHAQAGPTVSYGPRDQSSATPYDHGPLDARLLQPRAHDTGMPAGAPEPVDARTFGTRDGETGPVTSPGAPEPSGTDSSQREGGDYPPSTRTSPDASPTTIERTPPDAPSPTTQARADERPTPAPQGGRVSPPRPNGQAQPVTLATPAKPSAPAVRSEDHRPAQTQGGSAGRPEVVHPAPPAPPGPAEPSPKVAGARGGSDSAKPRGEPPGAP